MWDSMSQLVPLVFVWCPRGGNEKKIWCLNFYMTSTEIYEFFNRYQCRILNFLLGFNDAYTTKILKFGQYVL